ncbi:MAG: ParA family protein [Gammaproteobacteria bacterium]|uniref:Chromosome partitioning protein ParA n=1 Tax=Marinobacter litoralis TaxID=187981 RepID=A0A3M2RCM4_9GAMM|nr:ParA family protein [Marinobacter litoralis]MBR9870228.1 ParA family protein [Gammaproteobacteria bacterium]RMJ02914.1 Chromosome partitioning protein ParA [Marinobacter litoralis]
MTRVIAVTNQKGGVGKTTTCVNLAASLVAIKRRVLLVDMDPQGNATMGSGVDKNALELSGYDLLTKRATAAEVMVKTDPAGFDLLPGNGDLTAAEVELMNEIGREHRLRLALSDVRDNYDYILIDCPPSLNLLTVNSLSAADSVLIPMQCEYYALEGLAALMNTVEQIKETVNPQLEMEGILRTMYDPRNSLTLDVSGQLREYFGDKVYRAVIPRNVRLAEAPSYGMPALNYDKASKGAIAYLAMAGEMVRRHGTKKTSSAVAV